MRPVVVHAPPPVTHFARKNEINALSGEQSNIDIRIFPSTFRWAHMPRITRSNRLEDDHFDQNDSSGRSNLVVNLDNSICKSTVQGS